MTLRARLVLALLLLAAVPTLAFTLFALDQLSRSTDRWFSPGVDRALESSLEISRIALTRVEATVLARADDWAAGLVPGPLDASRRAGLRDGLREAGLDFAHVYVLANGRWRLEDQVTPAGVLAADSLDFTSELSAALDGSRLIHSRSGALAGTARAGERAVAVGIRLTPDFFAKVDQVSQARGLYRRLGVVVDVQQRWVWVLVLGLAALLGGLAWWLARRLADPMTRPLAELSEAFERVAAGNLDTRVQPTGATELKRLGASFNTMTGRLAEARERVATAEREAAWREVARRLAHEIKNPLTPMRLSLHRLQKRIDLVPEAQRAAARDSLSALLQEVEHLTRLAEQFSQYARLPEARIERVDLAELAKAAVSLHEPEHVRLRADHLERADVAGDRLLLSRALHNLLLNACEASPSGAEVEVRTGVTDGQSWAEVLDRGPGPPAELAEHVFEPYVSTKNRGSGLGLSLVRDIATQHQGTATLTARAGGGAIARLALPHPETPA